MTINIKDLAAGVQNKTNIVLAIAHRDGNELEAINKRMLEIAGMIELLGHTDHPNYKAIHWLRRYQDQLYGWKKDIEGG